MFDASEFGIGQCEGCGDWSDTPVECRRCGAEADRWADRFEAARPPVSVWDDVTLTSAPEYGAIAGEYDHVAEALSRNEPTLAAAYAEAHLTPISEAETSALVRKLAEGLRVSVPNVRFNGNLRRGNYRYYATAKVPARTISLPRRGYRPGITLDDVTSGAVPGARVGRLGWESREWGSHWYGTRRVGLVLHEFAHHYNAEANLASGHGGAFYRSLVKVLKAHFAGEVAPAPDRAYAFEVVGSGVVKVVGVVGGARPDAFRLDENGDLVGLRRQCSRCYGQGSIATELDCPKCGGTGDGPRGGRRTCRPCHGFGRVHDQERRVPCPKCEGVDPMAAEPARHTDTVPTSVWHSLPIEVRIVEMDMTWGMANLGLGSIYASTDYGRAWSGLHGDEPATAAGELALKVSEHTYVQACKVSRAIDGVEGRWAMADRIVVEVRPQGYRVVAEFDGDPGPESGPTPAGDVELGDLIPNMGKTARNDGRPAMYRVEDRRVVGGTLWLLLRGWGPGTPSVWHTVGHEVGLYGVIPRPQVSGLRDQA